MATVTITSNEGALESASAVLEVTATNLGIVLSRPSCQPHRSLTD
jgi:hypothetical protein